MKKTFRSAVAFVSIALIELVASGIPVLAADWPMRGRDRTRNSVVSTDSSPINWQFGTDTHPPKMIRWSAEVGTLSQGDPVISEGLVWIGTNNGRPRDPSRKEDAGVLMCFDERDGRFLYQYVSPRLSEGRDVDWPGSSQAGSPFIERDRLWFCNNRCEVICLDISPLKMRRGPPNLVWKVDLRREFGVFCRGVMIGTNCSQCSIAAYGDLIYVNTTNAKRYDGIPAPESPSLICFEKKSGQVKWQDNSPGKNLVDVQHGSPLVVDVQDQPQVIMGQGDGWMRGFDALTGQELWRFDINLKSSKRWERSLNQRNDLVAMPVYHEGRVFFATGRQQEMCDGPGRMCCLDPTGRGDISSELTRDDGTSVKNPNSGLVWEYLGKSRRDDERLHDTVSSVAIHDSLVFCVDAHGIVHCVDSSTGEGIWIDDSSDDSSASPLILKDRVYITRSSSVDVFALSRQKKLIAEHRLFESSFIASPAFANGTLFLLSRHRLYAIAE